MSQDIHKSQSGELYAHMEWRGNKLVDKNTNVELGNVVCMHVQGGYSTYSAAAYDPITGAPLMEQVVGSYKSRCMNAVEDFLVLQKMEMPKRGEGLHSVTALVLGVTHAVCTLLTDRLDAPYADYGKWVDVRNALLKLRGGVDDMTVAEAAPKPKKKKSKGSRQMYSWSSECFKNFTAGSIVVLARSVDQARTRILGQFDAESSFDLMDRELLVKDLAGEPTVTDRQAIFFEGNS